MTRASVRIALIHDAVMARYHREYLGRRGPTDVLTFDLGEGADGRRPVDADILISIDTAAREARRRGHALSAEIALYAVHGTLHVLGYDDHRPSDARRMHRVEDEVLRVAGVGPVFALAARGGRRVGEAS